MKIIVEMKEDFDQITKFWYRTLSDKFVYLKEDR